MPTSNSAYDLRQSLHGRDSYYDQGGYNNGGAYGNGAGPNGAGPRQRYSRVASEPQIHGHLGGRPGEQNIYPVPNNHRSYETVASGAGSGTSGEPAGYQTDPTSSDNSSIERRQSPSKPLTMMGPAPPQHQPQMNNGGPSGYNNQSGYNAGYNQAGYSNGGYNNGGYGGGYGGPKQAGPAPIQLSSAPQYQQQQQQGGMLPQPAKNVITRKPTNLSNVRSVQSLNTTAGNDKRKSWFARTFSRKE